MFTGKECILNAAESFQNACRKIFTHSSNIVCMHLQAIPQHFYSAMTQYSWSDSTYIDLGKVLPHCISIRKVTLCSLGWRRVVIYREHKQKIGIVENFVGSWSQKDVNSKKSIAKTHAFVPWRKRCYKKPKIFKQSWNLKLENISKIIL
jgi:hypothetical protein